MVREEIRIEALEEQHRRGYELHPVRPGELDHWETEQVWPDWDAAQKR